MAKKPRSAKTFVGKKTSARPPLSQLAAWGAIALFMGMTGVALSGGGRIALPQPAAEITSISHDPRELSAEDTSLYRAIASAQNTQDYDTVDDYIDRLSNRALVGYVLAERYLDGAYQASEKELSAWLAQYHDHPQLTDIARLARARGVEVGSLPKAPEALRGEGGVEHLGRSTMPDAWFTGLGFWREGEMREAYRQFAELSTKESLGDWQRSAAHYWAYRAAEKLGDEDAAEKHLQAAGEAEQTFYGLLALAKQGSVNIDAEAPEISDRLRENPRIIRATLLSALGNSDAAETELRLAYGAASAADRAGLITIASELNLPNLQMRLARTPGLSEAEARFARFPMPQYMVDLHGIMDSALIMAVARNESGFREVAQSSAGAVGMMQMLPSTAKAVERHVGIESLRLAYADNAHLPVAERLNEPSLSARYGAEYLRMISREQAVQRNLIHLLVGYNAGIGRVISWKAAAGQMRDPLLYIESIPYPETRNYVMQVSAQYWTYQRMMDETPVTLHTLARGEWPALGGADAQ
jgi:soluble lytic murein transglycosylase